MPVYLDRHAATPLDPRVWDAMLPDFSEHQGNPSSVHRLGCVVRAAIEKTRHASRCADARRRMGLETKET